MLNILSILEYVVRGLEDADSRFTIIDDEHFMDSVTGIQFHIYDDWSKMTHDGKMVAKSDYLTREEVEQFRKMKTLIASPEAIAKRLEEYPRVVYAARKEFARHYEVPQPLQDKIVEAEEGTIAYTG